MPGIILQFYTGEKLLGLYFLQKRNCGHFKNYYSNINSISQCLENRNEEPEKK